ncbi:MAG: alpha/beta hydrolase [Anaerolineaceae bacterium]|nr:alpha/beta hydrolase [Anaerolineaceae bacterium]
MSGYPLERLGGQASSPTLLLAPANGFPPRCYEPLLAPLARDWRLLALPPRAMWPVSEPPPTAPGSWQSLADDLLAGMAQHGLEGAVALGHSMGAVVLLLAALREPQRFRALSLLDPAILSEERLGLLRGLRDRGELDQMPLAQGALERKHRFASQEAAFTYWRPKPLFADWSDSALWAYTRSMTRPARDGAGLELSWRRDWEAWYYSAVELEPWSALARLEGQMPTLLLQGADSETFPADSFWRARALLPSATLASLPACGHLFPLSHPDETRSALTVWLATLR